MLHNQPDSDQMSPCKPPPLWIAGDRLCTFDSPQTLSLVPTTLTSCTPGEETGHVSLTISHDDGVSQRLTETHCELPACPRQRDRQACLNALCFCHNGQAFGGFAHLLQRINLGILHNTAFLPNPTST